MIKNQYVSCRKESGTPCLTIGGLKYHTEYTATYNARTGLLEKTSIDSSTSCHDWDIWEQRYEYDEKGRLTATSLSSHDTAYTYDDAGRVTGYVLANYNSPIVDNTYIYGTNGTYATNRLIEIKNNNYKNVGSTYTYNAQGYVTGYTTDRNWYNDYTYTYDTLGRLTSETYNGETFTYTYDNKNNVQKTGLTYTNGKLTSVDGKAIVYDAMGNPTTYKGKAFTWTQGRKLAAGSMNGNTFTYEYDGNGMRYEKTVNGKKTEYYWNGSQLLYEYRQDLGERIYYIYDASGIAGILYRNDVYYFAKNAFGDIVAIFDEGGQQVAEYVYDAWGNIIYENYDYSDRIGEINPFRYRGYYYDTETGFYYLQTRYYDPTICRFINADNYELVGALSCVPGQLNLYAYANNNPIMYTDETGEGVLTVILVVGGIILSGLITGGVAVATKNETESSWGAFAGGFITGVVGAAGLAAGIATGGVAGGVIAIGAGFLGGTVGNAVDQQISYGDVKWSVALTNGALNAVTGGFTYFGYSLTGLYTGGNWLNRFNNAAAISEIGIGISLFFSNITLPNPNNVRNKFGFDW